MRLSQQCFYNSDTNRLSQRRRTRNGFREQVPAQPPQSQIQMQDQSVSVMSYDEERMEAIENRLDHLSRIVEYLHLQVRSSEPCLTHSTDPPADQMSMCGAI